LRADAVALLSCRVWFGCRGRLRWAVRSWRWRLLWRWSCWLERLVPVAVLERNAAFSRHVIEVLEGIARLDRGHTLDTQVVSVAEACAWDGFLLGAGGVAVRVVDARPHGGGRGRGGGLGGAGRGALRRGRSAGLGWLGRVRRVRIGGVGARGRLVVLPPIAVREARLALPVVVVEVRLHADEVATALLEDGVAILAEEVLIAESVAGDGDPLFAGAVALDVEGAARGAGACVRVAARQGRGRRPHAHHAQRRGAN